MKEAISSRLSLTFVTGFNDDGEPIFKLKNYQNIKPEAEDANVYETAVAIASLQQHELDRVERSNTYDLSE